MITKLVVLSNAVSFFGKDLGTLFTAHTPLSYAFVSLYILGHGLLLLPAFLRS